jgi:ABC-type sugar transport system substrate-binding protein
MTVTPDTTARAARAGEALISRHAELQAVLNHWAGVLAAAADSAVDGPRRGSRVRARSTSPAAPEPA